MFWRTCTKYINESMPEGRSCFALNINIEKFPIFHSKVKNIYQYKIQRFNRPRISDANLLFCFSPDIFAIHLEKLNDREEKMEKKSVTRAEPF